MELLLDIKHFIEWLPSVVTMSIVFFTGLITFHILERIYPPVCPAYTTGPTRKGYLADFTASIVEGPVMYALTKMIIYCIIMEFPVLVDGGMSTWPWVVQGLVFLLVNDFARYWMHRWHHESNFLWRFHRVHHTVTQMDAMSTFRVHLFEATFKYGFIVLPFHFMHCDKSVIVLYSTVDILKGFWHHANVRTHIGRLNYIFNSAELHWWHHSVEAKGQLANYGSILSIWDWLFGTAYYEKGVWPDRIGVEGMDNFPETYHEMFATARFTDDQVIERFGPKAADVTVAGVVDEASTAGETSSVAEAQAAKAAPREPTRGESITPNPATASKS
ncbi:MAG TPA: sterol desaturase family protein [Phycisphaerae bacterium]|nr:sterol desaturase family protein [Phycisphaerae bacterium]HRW54277.1 sterol desaturase family protein [Phycisphaerae bacterium]